MTLVEITMTDKTAPSTFLTGILGNRVSVKLNNGVDYLGKLQSIDGYMNIVMDACEEFVNGKASGAKYGDVFIRGNNVLYIQKV